PPGPYNLHDRNVLWPYLPGQVCIAFCLAYHLCIDAFGFLLPSYFTTRRTLRNQPNRHNPPSHLFALTPPPAVGCWPARASPPCPHTHSCNCPPVPLRHWQSPPLQRDPEAQPANPGANIREKEH
ncbi:hypothetical protein Vretifemale_15701, partial [Volvox reticuliferus]